MRPKMVHRLCAVLCTSNRQHVAKNSSSHVLLREIFEKQNTLAN